MKPRFQELKPPRLARSQLPGRLALPDALLLPVLALIDGLGHNGRCRGYRRNRRCGHNEHSHDATPYNNREAASSFEARRFACGPFNGSIGLRLQDYAIFTQRPD
jgi:hypothetical protein